MPDKDSHESATNLSVPHQASPEAPNTGGSTANGLYTNRDLKKLRFKKNPRPDGPAEESPAKRIKLSTDTPQTESGGVVVDASGFGQNRPAEGSVPLLPRKRGRPPQVKSEDQIPEGIPNGQAKDTPAKKARAPRVKPDGHIANSEKDTVSKKPKVLKARVGETEEGAVKQKLTKKEKIAQSKELLKLEPKWTVVAPLPDAEPQASSRSLDLKLVQTKHRPRIWMSNREEYLSVMPEMTGSKCFNGVSWEMYETPTLVFDEFNTAFRVVCKDGDPRFIDLVTTRKFISPLQRREPEAQRQEVFPAPDQLQFTMPVDDPKPAEYLAKMEPSLYRMPSPDPLAETEEVPDTLTAQFTMRQQAARRTNAFVPEPEAEAAFSSTMTMRTNFSAPLLMYNVNDSVGSSISGPSSWVDNSWQPDGALPSGLPIANIAIQHSPEVDIEPVEDFDNEVALVPENVEPSVTPATPIYDLTLNDTTETLGGKSAPGAKKRRKEKGKNDGPRRSSGRLEMIHSSVQDQNTMAKPDPMPLVQSSCGTNESSARDEIGVLDVPANDLETRTNSNLVSSGISNGLPKQDVSAPTSHVVTASIHGEKEDGINQTETQNGVHGADDGSMQAVVKSEPQSENPLHSSGNGPSVDDTAEVKGLSDDPGFIPSSLPKEIQVMIDAYLFGRPLTLIASREHLIKYWSLLLPEEFGYVVMGYFKIIGVQETRVGSSDLPSLPVGLQSTSGYVNWSFHLQWRPGGEEFIMPNVDRQVLEHPWWEPLAETVQVDPLSEAMMEIEQQEETSDVKPSAVAEQALTSTDAMMGIEQEEKLPKVNPELEEEFPTTPRYLQARMAHHEYQYRHDHFRELYECLLPSFLLAPFGPLLLDTLLARGWFCQDCGKVNYQSMLRHRRCSSPFCKERAPVIEPYALDLFTIRDPQDRLPISFPYNVIPHSLVTDVKSYEGGTKTLSYSLEGAGAAFVYHIFTGNVPLLQEHATTLLEQVQLQVELVRPFNDNTPYFTYVARGPRQKKKKNNVDVPWENVPACINEAKVILADRAGKFTGVEKSSISISQLKLLAWVASGSRNGPETLRATKKCIVLLSFGCDIVLTLTPRFVERSSMRNAKKDDKTDDENDAEHDTNTPEGVTVPKEETVKAPKIKAVKKSEKLSIVLYLVHGDCVVLDGDDFEYSMKRDGTSFLLIASHHEK